MRYRTALVATLIVLLAGCTEDAPPNPAPAPGGPPAVSSTTRPPALGEPANQLRGAALTGPLGGRPGVWISEPGHLAAG